MMLTRRLSFKSKLFLSYIFIVLIPVSISVAWIFDQVILPIRGERLEAIDQSVDGLRADVEAEVEDIEKTGYLISTNIVLKKALLKRYYDESEIIEVMNTSIESLLSWFSATQRDNGQFHFFTVNETLPESDFFIPAAAVANEPWFGEMRDQLKSKYPYWESWHVGRDYPYDKSDGSTVYSMFYPINEDYLEEMSYLEFEVDADRMYERLDKTTLGQSGFVFALAWDRSHWRMPARASSSLVDGMKKLDAFLAIDLRAESTGSIMYEGRSYRYVIKPVNRLSTSFVGIVPGTELDGPWTDTRNVFLLLIASLAVLLGALSFWLAGLVIRKVQRIAVGVRQIRQGNFDARIEVRGEDEIDWLARNVNAMAGQIGELIDRVYKSQVSQKDAELRALQAQIHPHFLFNTLETLRMMAETRDERQLADAIAALGGMMRYNLAEGRDFVSLATEMEHLRDYVQIQNLLRNNRISLSFDVSVELQEYRMPNLLLQPLVENCIVHGMKGLAGELAIRVSAERGTLADGTPLLRIHVADNGVGIGGERLEKLRRLLATLPDDRQAAPKAQASVRSGGVGLANVGDRIGYYFGPLYGLVLESGGAQTLAGGDTVVTLTLPASSAT